MTELRAALPWLADVPRNVCSQLLVELDNAWQRCFAKLARAPRWKRKGVTGCRSASRTRRCGASMASTIRFPKLGTLRAVLHRPLEGKPKTCTLKRDGDQWFASIVCEMEVAEPGTRDGPVVAIDRGIANFGATSDGDMIANPKHLEGFAPCASPTPNAPSADGRKDRRTGRRPRLASPASTAR